MCHERCRRSAKVRGHNVNEGIVASFPDSPLAPTKNIIFIIRRGKGESLGTRLEE